MEPIPLADLNLFLECVTSIDNDSTACLRLYGPSGFGSEAETFFLPRGTVCPLVFFIVLVYEAVHELDYQVCCAL